MNKPEIIKSLQKANPLRSVSNWKKVSKEELISIYNEGIELGLIKGQEVTL